MVSMTRSVDDCAPLKSLLKIADEEEVTYGYRVDDSFAIAVLHPRTLLTLSAAWERRGETKTGKLSWGAYNMLAYGAVGLVSPRVVQLKDVKFALRDPEAFIEELERDDAELLLEAEERMIKQLVDAYAKRNDSLPEHELERWVGEYERGVRRRFAES